jgi:hypothetical protein
VRGRLVESTGLLRKKKAATLGLGCLLPRCRNRADPTELVRILRAGAAARNSPDMRVSMFNLRSEACLMPCPDRSLS